jgi:hypothetical protein
VGRLRFDKLTAGRFDRLTAGRFDRLTAGGFDGLTTGGIGGIFDFGLGILEWMKMGRTPVEVRGVKPRLQRLPPAEVRRYGVGGGGV